jgi:tetratricopeptide (TPR) repeat protein
MRLFTTPKVISLFFVLALPVQLAGLIASPCLAAAKSKKASKPQSKVPINTTPGQTAEKPLDLSGIQEHLEGRLNVAWRPNSIGKTKYCEVHFFYLPNGNYTDVSIWRSSGDTNYDQAAKNTIDQSGPYGPFEGVERLEVIATFKTEAKAADVVVRFPKYQGATSKAEREIAAKKVQLLNTIKIMKQRIVDGQKVLGSDSPKLSQSINFLANTYREVGDYPSAEAAFKWAIAIREKANGPNSRELAESLNDLGEMYRLKGDMVNAEGCYKRVLNMSSLKPSVEMRTAVHDYAKFCLYQKRKSDADFLFQRVNDIQAGNPLAPLPASLSLDTATSQDGAPKDSPASDTKGGDKPPGDKAADASKPKESKADDKAGDQAAKAGDTSTKASETVKATDPNNTAPVAK